VEPEHRPIEVDLGKLDLEKARTEALRLLASSETDVNVHVAEAARVMTELFEDLDLDAVNDETLSTLAHRIMEIIAGLTIVGSRSLSALEEETNVERTELLHQIETEIEEDMADG
jgi:hypothetical protein